MSPSPATKSKKQNRRRPSSTSRSQTRAAVLASTSTSPIPSSSSATGKRRAETGLTKPTRQEPDDEQPFEDPYGDEFEKEQLVDHNAPPLVNPLVANDAVVFRPGRDAVADGEKLVCDETAYDVFLKCAVEWPALSFDFVCMNRAGEYDNLACVQMETWPMSVGLVMGTQAENGRNKLVCVKMSNIHRNTKSGKGISVKTDEDSDDSDSEDEDGLEGEEDGNQPLMIDRDAVLQSAEIRMDSTINRIRVMPQRSNIAAAWTESGRVSLIDIAPAMDTLNLDSRKRMQMPNWTPPSSVKPFYSFSGHRREGFALDWSRASPGRLLSGDCDKIIYLTEPTSREAASWTTSPDKFRGHTSSVEDIQWSPNEPNVFASCSSDKSIRFWDTREYRRSALNVANAHDADVNVISWNRNETHLIVSGGDDGVIRVWDLRALDRQGDNSGAKPAAEFIQHQKAITSVQWHPKDSSMLCASSEDNTITIWDLAVERDAEEELREGVVLSGAEDLPPQLLFIHMGQNNVKDAQWHPACPSLIVSTAQDGLNMFQPSNIALPT